MPYLLYPIAIYLLLTAVTYFMIFQRILGVALQYPRLEIQPENDVPTDLKALFQQPIAELEALGFQVCAYVQAEQVMSLADLKNWSVLLYNKAAKTYAGVEIRFPIEPVNPFATEFLTFFKDRTLLLTINGKLHGLIGEIPNTILQDPYAADLAGQWQCHQSKLTQLTTKQPCGLAPVVFVTALQAHLGKQIDQLVKTKQVLPLAGTPNSGKQRFHYTWQAALRLAIQIKQGGKKAKAIVKQRSQQAKTNQSVRLEVPVALEVEGFRRQQQIEKGQVKRRLGRWVLLGSLILSIAAFSTRFDTRTIAILIGVLFLHELGHFLAMRLFGYRDTSMFFLPFFGAAVTGHKDDASLSEKFWVLMAGPLPGLLLGIGLAVIQGRHSASWAQGGLWMLIGLNLFNLLPIYPLDGGKIANLLLFSRFSYTDVLFKLFAVLVLLLLGLGSPLLLGIALAVGFSIPAGFRSAKVDAKLRQDYPKALHNQDEILHAIFATMKSLGYGSLPFTQRHILAKEVFQRHREAHAKWLTRIALSGVYAISLIGGMAGALQAIAPNWHRLIGTALENPQTRIKREIADATKTLAVNSNDVDAYMKRGRMRLVAKDYQGAIADANQLIRLQTQVRVR